MILNLEWKDNRRKKINKMSRCQARTRCEILICSAYSQPSNMLIKYLGSVLLVIAPESNKAIQNICKRKPKLRYTTLLLSWNKNQGAKTPKCPSFQPPDSYPLFPKPQPRGTISFSTKPNLSWTYLSDTSSYSLILVSGEILRARVGLVIWELELRIGGVFGADMARYKIREWVALLCNNIIRKNII